MRGWAGKGATDTRARRASEGVFDHTPRSRVLMLRYSLGRERRPSAAGLHHAPARAPAALSPPYEGGVRRGGRRTTGRLVCEEGAVRARPPRRTGGSPPAVGRIAARSLRVHPPYPPFARG